MYTTGVAEHTIMIIRDANTQRVTKYATPTPRSFHITLYYYYKMCDSPRYITVIIKILLKCCETDSLQSFVKPKNNSRIRYRPTVVMNNYLPYLYYIHNEAVKCFLILRVMK